MKIIPTPSVQIELVSFEKFLSLIPRVESQNDVYVYHTRECSNITPPEQDQMLYGSRIALTTDNPILNSFASFLRVQQVYKYDLQEMIEVAAVDQMDEYGLPTHAVMLQNNILVVSNPEDFRILVKGDTETLIPLSQGRAYAYMILDMTEEQAIALIKKEYPTMDAEKYVRENRRFP